jgi:hypothetical protein
LMLLAIWLIYPFSQPCHCCCQCDCGSFFKG